MLLLSVSSGKCFYKTPLLSLGWQAVLVVPSLIDDTTSLAGVMYVVQCSYCFQEIQRPSVRWRSITAVLRNTQVRRMYLSLPMVPSAFVLIQAFTEEGGRCPPKGKS